MALVTVQRSPSPTNSQEDDDRDETDVSLSTEVASEGRADSVRSTKSLNRQKSLTSECYFAVKGAAVILPQNECIMVPRQSNNAGGEIQLHLQSMLHLLRAQDTLKMAVRLQSLFSQHSRYMAIVSTTGRQDNHESILLGVDYVGPESTSIGLVVPIWASTCITLDGDGGILIESGGSQHIFKPVSVQAMWSAFQSLHKEHDSASTPYPYIPGGLTHTWVQYYEARTASKDVFRSEWHYVYCKEESEDLRADSLQKFRDKPPEKSDKEKLIRSTLKDIMQSVDLDEVTSKDIRDKLEAKLNMNLHYYKEFIDQEMLIILGQMDQPSKIFDYLYLGTEWNASNWDELRQNNVGYIVNVTKEVDNFFPGIFHYMKIRVSDEESSELLKHWDLTYKFICKAKENNVAVLVHCKKGISRSSSTVVAYAMKCYGWSLEEALNYVKEKRNCITPNKGFLEQLKTYQGILQASQNRRSHLFNKPLENPQSSEVTEWDGLLEEFDEDSACNKCFVTHPDSNAFVRSPVLKPNFGCHSALTEPFASNSVSDDVKFMLFDQHLVENSSTVWVHEDFMPNLNYRLAAKCRLRDLGCKTELKSLKIVQKSITRRSDGQPRAGSFCSSSSSSFTGPSSAEEEDDEQFKRESLGENSAISLSKRRNSKSSSGGDSAVADLKPQNFSTARPDSRETTELVIRRHKSTDRLECKQNRDKCGHCQSTVLRRTDLSRPLSYMEPVLTGRVKSYTHRFERSTDDTKSQEVVLNDIAATPSSAPVIPRAFGNGKKFFEKFFHWKNQQPGNDQGSLNPRGSVNNNDKPVLRRTKWYLREVPRCSSKDLPASSTNRPTLTKKNNAGNSTGDESKPGADSRRNAVETSNEGFNKKRQKHFIQAPQTKNNSHFFKTRLSSSWNQGQQQYGIDNAPRTSSTHLLPHSGRCGTKMVRSLVNVFEQSNSNTIDKQALKIQNFAPNSREFLTKSQQATKNRANFRRVESAGLISFRTDQIVSTNADGCGRVPRYYRSASVSKS